jgi:hypothetical protein
MKTEKEIRFILSDDQFELMKSKALKLSGITYGHAVNELTVMYDNPNPGFTFYNKEVDGRLRVRTSKAGRAEIFKSSSTDPSVSMITWKQRIPQYIGDELNQEREVEVNIESEEMSKMITILEDILHCPRISSYERNRETFYLNGSEVASDTFPYGHVVEIELKESDDVNALYRTAQMLGIDGCIKSSLSCDDMYRYLCEKQGLIPKSDILFSDMEMPSLNSVIKEGGIS